MHSIKHLILLLYSLVAAFACCGQTAFSPLDLPNLVLWLRADSGVILNSGAVSQWSDISGNSNHAIQSTASARPVFVNAVPELNNYPAIRFDGSNDFLNGTTMPGVDTSSLSFFIVTKGISTSNTAAKYLFAIGVLANGHFLYHASANALVIRNNGQNHTTNISLPNSGYPNTLIEVIRTVGSNVSYFRNGVAMGNSSSSLYTSPFTNGNYAIGNGNGAFLSGEIAEVIIYQTPLNATDRVAVEQYIFNKYAPPVNLGPDTIQQYGLCPITLNAGNRFVNYQWSTGATSSSITVNQNGTYSVTTTDVFGRVSSDTIQVTFPTITLNTADTTICLGNSISLSPQIQFSNLYSYLWSNGQTGSSVSINTAGAYSVTITDTSNCTKVSNVISISIDSFPVQLFLGNDTSLCSGNTISLIQPSTGWNNLQFLWSDNSTDSLLSVSSNGVYAVTVTNERGCIGIDSIQVNILGNAPTVTFTGDTLCLGKPYTPVNTSISNDTSALISFHWNFGNGDSSNLPHPSYYYNSSGIYNVSLTVLSGSGCTQTAAQQVIVKNNPTAQFQTTLACVNNSYQFFDASSPPSGGIITTWNWNFGDGNTANSQNPFHTYFTPASYLVTLIVTADNSCFDTLVNTITVVNSAPQPDFFELVTPPNNAHLTNATVNFVWNSSTNAQHYSLLISSDSSFTTATIFSNIVATQHVVALTGNQTFFWKVIAYNVCGDSVTSPTHKFSVFSPNNIPNLALWLRADSGVIISSGAISQWNDGSGNNNHATQSTVSARPVLVNAVPELNNYPAVRFDGINDFLSGNTIAGLGNSSLSVFIVTKGNQTNNTAAKYFLALGSLASGYVLYHASANVLVIRNNGQNLSTNISLPNSGYQNTLIEVVKEIDSSVNYYRNGIAMGSSPSSLYTSAFVNGNYTIGNGSSVFLSGEIAEVIVYQAALNNVNRNAVEQYIFYKYAPPVNLGPDIHQTYSLCPVILDAQNRFVSYLWSTGETTSSIEVRKSGTYWVQTTDVFGRTSSDTINVTIPYVGMNVTDTLLCIGSSVTVAPVLTSSPYTYLWNNAQTTPSINVTTAGSYVCSITDSNNCTFVSDTVHVGIDAFASVNLLPTDTAMCIGNNLPLNLAGNTPQSVVWSDNSTNLQFTVYAAGSYSVTVTNTNGCTATDAVNISIKGTAPLVNFSAPSVCFGEITYFTDETLISGSDHINAWHWDFDGAGTSNLQNPTKIFPAPGTYNVTLSVVTDSGCTGAKTKQVISAVPPEPSFTYPPIICGGTPVTLTDKTVFLFGDTVTGWIWTFNGTDTITTQNAVYQFPGQGVYNVSLTAVSKSGCKKTYTQPIDVFPSLTADFTVSNTCLGDSASFKDVTPTFSVVSWLWNFGDFSPLSDKQNPKHKFSTAGTYTVTLTIENAIGCKDDVTKQVSIVNKPTANFGNLITCEDRYYTPLDSSTTNNDTISVWRWTIAGNNYTGKTPSHLFADTGNYSIKLKVTTQKGCVDSVVKTVSVKPVPKAQFSYTPLYGDAPVDVSFINQSLYGATYFWNFGDGDVSTLHSPIHTYATNDTFLISLSAQSAFGCVDSTQRIFIAAPTELDIAVSSVTTNKQLQPDGSYLIGVEANVSNMATRVITDVLFYITIGSGGAISEEWSGLLNTGETQPIAFTAKFVAAPENANSYVCVKAVSVNNGENELRTDNNQQCTTVNQGIQLVGPSPNPMSHQATLGIILPKAGEVTIDIVNTAGQYIVKGEQVAAPKGRSDYFLPADKMRAGEYYIRVHYNDETLLRKFIVAK